MTKFKAFLSAGVIAVGLVSSVTNAQNTPQGGTPAPTDYRASDHCGPSFIQDNIPTYLATPLQDAIASDFRNVCRAHDACYRANLGQAKCDDDMVRGMKAVCDRKIFFERPYCRFKARAMNAALRTTFGGYAYGHEQIGGQIVKVVSRRINSSIGDDEVEACVTVRNPTNRILEYDVEMYTWDMKRVDIEPDSNERNIAPGQQSVFCVGTNMGLRYSRRDLGGNFKIFVRVDDPDSFAIWGDMIVVDKGQYDRP